MIDTKNKTKLKSYVVQMRLVDFVKAFPRKWQDLCDKFGFGVIDATDEEYIIRFNTSSGIVEVGYASDDWTI